MWGGEHLELGLLVEGNVGHLLAGVEQGVLGRLGEHVLCGSHQHGCVQGRHAQVGDAAGKQVSSQDQAEECKACRRIPYTS